MRIAGGRNKGRRLVAPAGRETRPTTDRVREALFGVIAHGAWREPDDPPLDGARVLDGFCGTGALGLEALSRGAAVAVLMDRAAPALTAARANVATLGEEARALVLRGDVLKPPRPPGPLAGGATLVFLDPPYGQDLAAPALTALEQRGWLAPGALCAVELAARDPFQSPASFIPLDRRSYGDTAFHLLRAPGRDSR